MDTATTPASSPATATAETDYHYVITVQTRTGVMNTREGVLTVPQGYTRIACLKQLMDQLRDEYGTPISILFFSLEPNQL